MTLICLWIIVHLVSGKLLAGEHPGFLRLPLASPIQAVIIFIFHTSGLSLRNVARAGNPLRVVGASNTRKPQELCSEMQFCPGSLGASLGLAVGLGFTLQVLSEKMLPLHCSVNCAFYFSALCYIVFAYNRNRFLLFPHYFQTFPHCGVEHVCKHWSRASCLIPLLALGMDPVPKPFPSNHSLPSFVCSEGHTAWILNTCISEGIPVKSLPFF